MSRSSSTRSFSTSALHELVQLPANEHHAGRTPAYSFATDSAHGPPLTTVVFSHVGSVNVDETTNLGIEFILSAKAHLRPASSARPPRTPRRSRGPSSWAVGLVQLVELELVAVLTTVELERPGRRGL